MPTGIYPRTEKHSFNRGRKHLNRKRPATNGITPIHKRCLQCEKSFVTNCFQPQKKFCSLSCSSKSRPEMNLENLQKRDREKQRLVVQSRTGEKHPNWKGGRSFGYKTGYYSSEYKSWRTSVFERDGYTCKGCDAKGVFITAHHIKSFAHFPELRFDINNGLTLCEPCHKLTDNYKGRNKKKRLTTT